VRLNDFEIDELTDHLDEILQGVLDPDSAEHQIAVRNEILQMFKDFLHDLDADPYEPEEDFEDEE
jgi:hypothetical protein